MNNNWIKVRFEELVDFIQPTAYIVKSTEYNDNNKIPVLTAGKSFIKGYTNETEGVFENIPCIIFDDFTTASQYVNFQFKVKSSAMKILVPACHLVNLKYVYYAMQVTKIKNDTHKRYWISDYSKKEIPFAPLNEQKRIVSKIEELFSELDNSELILKQITNQILVYKQALLKNAFEGKLTEEWRKKNKPKSSKKLLEQIKDQREKTYENRMKLWEIESKKWKEMGENRIKPIKPKLPANIDPKNNINYTFNKNINKIPQEWAVTYLAFLTANEDNAIIDGPFGSSINVNKDYVEKGIPVIRIINILPNEFSDKNLKYITPDKFEILKRHNVIEGDVLFTKVGTIGNSCVYPSNKPEAILSTTGSARIRTDKQVIYPSLLSLMLNSFKNEFNNIASAAVQSFLNMSTIKNFPLPIMTLEEQKVILDIVQRNFSIIESFDKTVESILSQSNLLRQSILKKAFDGRLVVQDPNDEPASVLLKQIKIEKEKYLENLNKKKKNTSKKNKKMNENLSIEEVLKSSESPMLAKDVWQQSKYKNSIEEFYAELKRIEHKIKEIKQDTESLLSLIEHADR